MNFMKTNDTVDFICAGAQKSGTTTLYGLLSQHPDVCLPKQKELYFFCDYRIYKKGYGWYEEQFACDGLRGDITPDYMLFPECAERIFKYNKNIKLLFILRNPADRAFSHYQMKKRDTEERMTFKDALEAENGRTSRGYRKRMKYSYMERGYYNRLLLPYYKFYSEDSIKVLLFEDFINDIDGSMREIEEFLGLTPYKGYILPERRNEGYLPKRRSFAYIKRHFLRPVRGIYNTVLPEGLRKKISSATEAGYLPKENMPDEIRVKLVEEYLEDIKKLENLLNRDLSVWYN